MSVCSNAFLSILKTVAWMGVKQLVTFFNHVLDHRFFFFFFFCFFFFLFFLFCFFFLFH